MPKSFLIKKILGLDEDQSVPSLKVEESCEDISFEDSLEHRKKLSPSLYSPSQHGQNYLHYPEYMSRSLALHSYLLSQKRYYPSIGTESPTTPCYCKDCLVYYRSAGIERGFLPIYHNPFVVSQTETSANERTPRYCSPVQQKRPYSTYDTKRPTEGSPHKAKIRVLESEKQSPHSPAAIVPDLKIEGSLSPASTKSTLNGSSKDSDTEIDTAYGSEESLDSFSNPSVESSSTYSGSRRGSDPFLTEREDDDSKDGAQGEKAKDFTCSNCPMTFARSSDLQRHSLIHSKEKPYVCYICDRGFTWFGNFQKHVLSHDGDYKVYHPLLFMKNTAEEELIIRDGANFKCKLCQKQFTRMSGLRTHVRMHTGQRPFKCNTCSFAFTTSRALKMHMRIHTGERPYKCDECPKAFTRRDELQAHIYMHKGEKPFKCDQCSSAFIRYGHLQRHLLTHSADKPYKCKWCTKSFTQYRNLQTHTYKHTGERPFKCNFCGKGFTQYGTLQAHERTHTGKKPFQCKDCDKAFITSSHLRWHMKRHHNDDKEIIDVEETK